KPSGSRAQYDAAYTHWGEQRDDPARDHYRVAWRAMAANTGERTLISAIIPSGTAHINAVFAVGSADPFLLVRVASMASSLLADLMVRCAPKSGIYQGVLERIQT